MLTEPEKRRYKRHIMLDEIGEEGQEKIKNSSILVIGAGGLGAPVMQYLTAAGVGKLTIMDDGMVNEDNLHRQILYGGQDLGKLKTIISRERLQSLNPLVKHEIINVRLKESNALDCIRAFDIIVDATDNFKTRYLINDACVVLGKPWVYGSIFRYEGQVSTFNYNQGPTLRCLFDGIEDEKNISNPSDYGLMGILPGIVGSFQANEVLKLITGIGEILTGKLMQINIMKNNFNFINFKKNPEKARKNLFRDENE